MGNLKYDMSFRHSALPEELVKVLAAPNPLWIAASTMASEESLILTAYGRLIEKHRDLRLLIAPRHPDRFDEVESLIKKSGFLYAKRTNLHGMPQVILLDSLGELAATFEFARVVFVGGSLVPHGGHNILEPAFFSKPILFGPHMENFLEISERFLKARAAISVNSSETIVKAIDTILSDFVFALELGENARKIVDENQGATERAIVSIREEMNRQKAMLP
jgi:3-deoxy-D-manno-octulosonic-acid transferase